MNKGYIALLIVVVMLSSGMTYALMQVSDVTRVNISKPLSIETVKDPGTLFGVRWSDSDLGSDPSDEPCVINLDEWEGNTLSASALMVNSGSTDLTVTWSTNNLPKGLRVEILTEYTPDNGVPWVGSLTLPRGTSYVITVKCIDDGTLVEGASVFDLVIVAG